MGFDDICFIPFRVSIFPPVATESACEAMRLAAMNRWRYDKDLISCIKVEIYK